MKQKYKIIAAVRAINSIGEIDHFDLKQPVESERPPTQKDRDNFFGKKFLGRKKDGSVCDYVVFDIRTIECVPEPFYLIVSSDCLSEAHGYIRLGDYDSPDDLFSEFRKSPLTNLEVRFELMLGEGLIFNRQDHAGFVTKSKFRWTKTDYIVTSELDEIWTFPKAYWELHFAADPDIDYVDPEQLRDSLPEITAW